ncbi:Rgp1-domain-containing protein [Lipomyces japonicus]|uniref:Rgp1-domain-containing protein n=1 Tax=Lipomyces japonicus TaxID=56871 RepID=UPI0034CF85B6
MSLQSQVQSFLRVEVAFSDPVYFAGEELRCKITFRNVAPELQKRASSKPRIRKSSFIPVTERINDQPQNLATQSSPSVLSPHERPTTATHWSNSSTASSRSASPSPGIVSSSALNGPRSPKISSQPPSPLLGRSSSMRMPKTRLDETIMMCYVQLHGSFTLEESLVKTSEFDDTKRQGIVGGKMGGGVVGLGSGKTEGALWGLGLMGLSKGLDGITNFLTGSEVSSIAEMKNLASSNSISILSTSQSLLFVDLRLNPGESKSYSYRIMLPRTLPPSYRGKALKIQYNLLIGTQKIGKGMQQPKTTKFPFRVFQNIDAGGNQPVHSLRSPIVLLHDEAFTSVIDDRLHFQSLQKSNFKKEDRKVKSETIDDFMAYVDSLLTLKPDRPVAQLMERKPSSNYSQSDYGLDGMTSCRESVDLAIQRNSLSADGLALNNVFEIARNRQKIGTLTLSKPVFKLGETIILALDFFNAVLPCYHVAASLETTEIIDPEIAYRTPSFNERATRKVYAQSAFTTLASKRASFSFCIPTTATPQFDTSYISSHWSVRLEFVTIPLEAPKLANDQETNITPESSTSSLPSSLIRTGSLPSLKLNTEKPEIIQLVHEDDRGATFSVVDNIDCETFDCRIPIKVFPTNQDIAAMSFQLQPHGGHVI